MRKIVVAIIVICLVFHAPFVEAKTNRELMKNQIEHLIQTDPSMEGAIASISIRSAKTGELLMEHNGTTRLRPASNMKLFTAATALAVLGDNYTFQTELVTDGNIKWALLDGNLYIKGKGDPTLLKEDIDQLVGTLQKKGVKFIRGDVIGDDSWYDDTRYSVDLPWSDETTYYGSAISALTVSADDDYDAGSIIVKVSPQDIGQSGKIQIEPQTEYVHIVNETETVSADHTTKITVNREHGTNTIIIEGTISKDTSEEKSTVAVWEPTDFALAMFEEALQQKGIKLLGEVKRGVTPENTSLLAVRESIPLSELMVPFMKLSNNGHAEVLVKEMGKVMKEEGSWEKGLEVMDEQLRSFGVETDTLVIRDGSGISHINLISANQLTKILFSVQSEDWFPVFLHSLPVSGGENRLERGTLYRRLANPEAVGKVKAKTGTLTTVSTLSGYVETKSGETVIFSILLNNVLDGKKAKQLEDQIVLQLVNL
ncbi:D-alanyl-D-alanine carboxypeptidase/D-alanyl-D-alanine-endopeptidase [Halalkalibacter alkaliphilus]|uniref:D-alanyl-D-alanine carboxypeptidase/D-alanyl-D-alanine-endopeptidase n=1 Tax=Halalkalibacter alkaliphilus TaxID=2917993 RepID=A0A9X2CMY5_9BACI|nr:D-alanyl-D-alanine carboxypeptidase/D-alanyl-D-alanine-endopeptidase [Halalkalibacter alkaliphilus]MCL7746053.1 D-alanyl-D-alanine carboxypeptidase/D-alanyl-D-alanine-endopeptidase [Halalkalibacter alkaliphilus]